MKYLKHISFGLFMLTILANVPPVFAQTRSTDNESIQQRLEDEGLDKAPDVVEVEPRQMSGQAPSSGFVDENGNPLSNEEYAEWRENNEKGFFKKYPWVLPIIIVAVAGGAFAVLKRKR